MMNIELKLKDQRGIGNGGENLLMGLARLEVLSRFNKSKCKVVISLDEGVEYNFNFDDPLTRQFYENCMSKVITEIGSGKYDI